MFFSPWTLWPAEARLNADDPDPRVLFPQVFPHSHEGAAGPHAGHEAGDVAAGLAEDFRPGRLVVGEDVVGVGVLIRHEVPVRLLRQDPVGEAPGDVERCSSHDVFLVDGGLEGRGLFADSTRVAGLFQGVSRFAGPPLADFFESQKV